jgi:hypothetical protein
VSQLHGQARHTHTLIAGNTIAGNTVKTRHLLVLDSHTRQGVYQPFTPERQAAVPVPKGEPNVQLTIEGRTAHMPVCDYCSVQVQVPQEYVLHPFAAKYSHWMWH